MNPKKITEERIKVKEGGFTIRILKAFYCSVSYNKKTDEKVIFPGGMMIKLFTSLFFIVVLVTAFSVNAQHLKTIEQDFTFADPVVKSDKTLQWVEISGLNQSIGADTPMLPFKQARILLPFGTKVKSVDIIREKAPFAEPLMGINNLRLSGKMLTLSSKRNYPLSTKTFAQIETQSEYPAPATYQIQQSLHQFQVLLVNLHPVYFDNAKNFYFSRKMRVKVELEESMQSREVITSTEDRLLEVENFVDNPQMIKTYPTELATRGETYDYLIVSSSDLINSTGNYSLNAFKSYLENKRGLKVKIANIQNIYQTMTNGDNAQKLRNYIRQEYINSGIKYVLLAGDSDSASPIIPTRQLYSEVRGYDGTSWKMIKEHIYADFYFACLDGDFNGNGNGTWGEKNDGINGGDVDMLCEVIVGRFPVANASELANVIKKTMTAYEMKLADNKRVLMAGEELFASMNLWGDDYMEKLIGTSNDHGYTTNGYDQTWGIQKLYDKQRKWSGTDVKNKINSGNFLMLNHLGHSNKTYTMRMNGGWMYRPFTNSRPFFLYTQGCFPGHFMANDSITENFFLESNGTFASVSNSSYGLGPEDPDPSSTTSPGASQMLHRFFINRILNDGDGLKFAWAHQKSKEDMIPYVDHQEARWVLWVANYFGDPALTIK